MIPKYKSFAFASSGYSAETSFSYTINGYNYQFYFDGSLDTLPGYYFQSDAIAAVIDKSSEFYNINFSSALGSKINYGVSVLSSAVFNMFRDFYIATSTALADWYTSNTHIYGWKFEYLGVDDNYTDSNIYGSAYGWRFTGILNETIDLVLDENGHIYGSYPIGNITSSNDVDTFTQWSINQHDGEDIWWQPYLPITDVDPELPEPYISGKSLFFYIRGNTEYKPSGWFEITDFTNTFINYGQNSSSPSYRYPTFYFLSPDHSINIVKHGTTGYQFNWQVNSYTNTIDIHSVHGNWNNVSGYYTKLEAQGGSSSQLISFNLPFYSSNGTSVNTTHYQNNYNGVVNYVVQPGNNDIYLASLTTTPISPISVPDDPVPLIDIDPDPTDFDPSEDPDPVPGAPYTPEPGPDPEPDVPEIPPVVSGNDELWPDLNDLFNAESDLDSFLNPLQGFEFTSFENLTSFFSSSIIWVSSIMMLLYNGSDFSVLFSVLSIFFIAAALLGIYKWWVSR